MFFAEKEKENIPTWLRLLRPWVECGNYDFGFILDQSATAPPNIPITYSSSAIIATRMYVNPKTNGLHTCFWAQQPRVWFQAFPKISEQKLLMLLSLINGNIYRKVDKLLENGDWTHLVVASGKLVLQKKSIRHQLLKFWRVFEKSRCFLGSR